MGVVAAYLGVLAAITGGDCCFCQKIGTEFDFFFQKFKKGLFLRLFASFLIFHKWKRLKFC